MLVMKRCGCNLHTFMSFNLISLKYSEGAEKKVFNDKFIIVIIFALLKWVEEFLCCAENDDTPKKNEERLTLKKKVSKNLSMEQVFRGFKFSPEWI